MLGPLKVLDADGHDVTPDGELPPTPARAPRVAPRRDVSAPSTAIEALWPTPSPQRDPLAALQTHVFRVRRGSARRRRVVDRAPATNVDAARVDVDADAVVSAVVEAPVRAADRSRRRRGAAGRRAGPLAQRSAVHRIHRRRGRPARSSSASKSWRVRAVEERAAALIGTGRARRCRDRPDDPRSRSTHSVSDRTSC